MALTKVKGSSFIDGTITDTQFANTTITTGDMAVDPRNADNYTTGSVPLAQLGNVPAADTTGLDNDIALLGFKTAANGSLAKYDLVDQTVDAFEDASGVDSGSSTNATRNASKYYSGSADTQTAFNTSTGNTTWTSPAGVTSATRISSWWWRRCKPCRMDSWWSGSRWSCLCCCLYYYCKPTL